jgi:hypothetical protein
MKSILLNQGRMVLVITIRMMVLKTLMDIQLALLHGG